jgi:hypothetical protein
MASIGLFFFILGAGQWVNGSTWGAYSLAFGLVWWLVVLYQWFRDSVAESEGGLYGHKIDLSYRWSMSWFIFSEVMFFGAFFTALWWARAHSVPALGSLENALIWPKAGTECARAHQRAVKNAPKNITSEKMNQLMLQRYDRSILCPYKPPSLSATESRNHWYKTTNHHTRPNASE